MRSPHLLQLLLEADLHEALAVNAPRKLSNQVKQTSSWRRPRTAQADLVGGVPAIKVNDLQELLVVPKQQARRVQVPARARQAQRDMRTVEGIARATLRLCAAHSAAAAPAGFTHTPRTGVGECGLGSAAAAQLAPCQTVEQELKARGTARQVLRSSSAHFVVSKPGWVFQAQSSSSSTQCVRSGAVYVSPFSSIRARPADSESMSISMSEDWW